MSANYRKLGDYIEVLNRRNTDLKLGLDSVRGISNTKQITETSKATVDESVISKFYVINPGEFVYNPRTTRMGDKVGLAFNNTDKPLLFTFNNLAFRIKDSAKDKLLPDYLYLFFCRSEFDRYARINSWGSATELFLFEDLCNIKFAVPDLKEQEKIVNTYNAITKRIQLKQKINENLEKTAQCLFEKSCNNENTEITLGEIVKFIDGDRGSNYPTLSDFYDDEYCLFLNASNVTEKGFNFDKCQFITEEKDKSLRKGHLSYNDIVLTSRGTVGNVALYTEMIQYKNVRINSGMLIIRPNENKISVFVLYALLRSIFMKKEIERFRSGSVQPQLPVRDLEKMIFRIPNKENCSMLNQQFKIIYESITTNFNEIAKLQELKQLVISRISGIQGEG